MSVLHRLLYSALITVNAALLSGPISLSSSSADNSFRVNPLKIMITFETVCLLMSCGPLTTCSPESGLTLTTVIVSLIIIPKKRVVSPVSAVMCLIRLFLTFSWSAEPGNSHAMMTFLTNECALTLDITK